MSPKKKDVKKTKSSFGKEVIGGFGSLFDISNLKVKDPVIVSCTDGVGTKIDLANKFKKFDTKDILFEKTDFDLKKKDLILSEKKKKKKIRYERNRKTIIRDMQRRTKKNRGKEKKKKKREKQETGVEANERGVRSPSWYELAKGT